MDNTIKWLPGHLYSTEAQGFLSHADFKLCLLVCVDIHSSHRDADEGDKVILLFLATVRDHRTLELENETL